MLTYVAAVRRQRLVICASSRAGAACRLHQRALLAPLWVPVIVGTALSRRRLLTSLAQRCILCRHVHQELQLFPRGCGGAGPFLLNAPSFAPLRVTSPRPSLIHAGHARFQGHAAPHPLAPERGADLGERAAAARVCSTLSLFYAVYSHARTGSQSSCQLVGQASTQ